MKRFMMAAVLFGAMTLGACVDNQESQSVTDIRDAKTEELKSQAALNNAAAEAAKVMANAEAALMAAEAEYQKALAEQVAAETELLEVEKQLAEVEVAIREAELEAALTELEAAKAELEATKADVQARIAASLAAKAAAEAQLEVDLAKAQAALLKQQLAVFNASKNLDAAKKIEYVALFNAYQSALTNLNAVRGDLLKAENNYAGVEAGIITADEGRADQIAAYENQISMYEKWIADYEARIAHLDEFITYTDEELEAKVEELVTTREEIQVTYNSINAALQNWKNNNPQPVDPRYSQAVNEYYDEINNWREGIYNGWERFPWAYATWDFSIAAPTVNYDDDSAPIGYYVPAVDPAYQDFVPMMENLTYYPYESEYTTVEFTNDEVEYVRTYSYQKYASTWKVNEAGFEAYLKEWAKKVENCPEKAAVAEAEKAVAEAEKAYNGEKGELAAYNKALEAYTKAKAADEAAIAKVEAAKKAVKDPAKPTETEKGAIADAEKAQAKTAEDLTKAIEALDAARTANDKAIAKIKGLKNDAKNAANDYGWYVADYEEAVAKFEEIKEMAAAAEEAINEWNAWHEAYVSNEAYTALVDYYFALDIVDAAIDAINIAYSVDNEFEVEKARLEGYIKNCEEYIVRYEGYIAVIEAASASDEDTLKALADGIEILKLKVAAYEAECNEAKAKLDAALAE